MSIENLVSKLKNVTLLENIVFRMMKRLIMQTRIQSEHKAATQNERKPTISVCKWKTPGVSPLPPNKRHKCRLTAHLRRYNFNAGLLWGGGCQIPLLPPSLLFLLTYFSTPPPSARIYIFIETGTRALFNYLANPPIIAPRLSWRRER